MRKELVMRSLRNVFRYLVSERLNRAIFVTHTDQWPMPSCLTTAQLK